ncbi:hypothetical protein T4E_5225 [Trichinella pseudospiralis]|uniref:Uncharacterized protein n=1 Tax=Trichinella pseudospiralis TaxID=6337 RepID=A0A0V0YNA1_TRIPS|nr:hypothetical protein T4E_5225 [Trichinella pseudospiralis]
MTLKTKKKVAPFRLFDPFSVGCRYVANSTCRRSKPATFCFASASAFSDAQFKFAPPVAYVPLYLMVIVDYQPSARATRYYSMLKLAANTHAGKMIWREHVNQIGQLGFRSADFPLLLLHY